MSQRRIVELEFGGQILDAPTDPYARRLLSDTSSLEVALEAQTS